MGNRLLDGKRDELGADVTFADCFLSASSSIVSASSLGNSVSKLAPKNTLVAVRKHPFRKKVRPVILVWGFILFV